MRQQGYRYATPLQAARDPQWAVAARIGETYRHVTAAQTATATADAACQAHTGLAATWDALNREYQDKIIAAYGPQLARANAVVNDWLANARHLGADTPATPATSGSSTAGTAAAAAAPGSALSPAVSYPTYGPFTYQNNASGLYLDSHGGTCNDDAAIDTWQQERSQ